MRATATAKNIGHDYWEAFANTNPSSVAQNLNSLQVRAHNKGYLAAYKKIVRAASTRHTTYSNATYTPAGEGARVFKTHPSLFAEVAGAVSANQDQLSEANRLMRSSFVEWESSEKSCHQDLSFPTPASTTAVTAPFNTQNPNKRFLRSRNFSMPDHLTLRTDLEPR